MDYSARARRRQTSPTNARFVAAIVLLVIFAVVAALSVSKLLARPAVPPIQPLVIEPKLEAIAQQEHGLTIATVATDVITGQTASINATQPFRAASTTKLITAIYFLHQVEQGKHSLTESVGSYTAREQLTFLINQSNNDSWTAFHDTLGRDEEEQYAHQLGLSSFQLATNTITSADLALLLRKLALGQLLNQADTHLLYTLMQHTIEESFLPPALPGVTLYHKTGTLEDDVHDIGLATIHGRQYVLVIMTNGQGTLAYDDRAQVFQRLVSAILQGLPDH